MRSGIGDAIGHRQESWVSRVVRPPDDRPHSSWRSGSRVAVTQLRERTSETMDFAETTSWGRTDGVSCDADGNVWVTVEAVYLGNTLSTPGFIAPERDSS
jgi:hypothetical protein